MKNRSVFAVLLVVSLMAAVGMAGFTPYKSALVDSDPAVPALPDGFKDFAGKWLAYNVISLDKGKSASREPGIHLEIAENTYRVEGASCDKPTFTVREINLNDFLKGKPEPAGSIEFYEKHFKILETGCDNIEPAAVALINSRTLAAVVGNDLIYFETDKSMSEGDLVIESTMQAESSEKPLYEIHAQIPVLKKEKSEKFNQAAQSIIQNELNDFREGFVNYEVPPEMANYRSFMWIGYDVPLLTEELISIRFTVDYMMAGAAHPGHHFRVFNYDLKNDEPISPDETLMNSTQMLKFLSEACLKSLDKPDFPLFPEGLEPKYSNFQNWNLTKTGLRISFDPYQVAPYAAGPQEVIIPYADIKELVRPDSAVGAFVAQH